MKIGFFKRITAILLLLAVLFTYSVSLVGCNAKSDDTSEDNGSNASDDKNGNGATPGDGTNDGDYHDRIVFPEYKDYARDTIDFDKIEYKTPDFEKMANKIRNVISQIEKNEISFEEQVALIEELEDDYTNILTMKTYADIRLAGDSSSTYWSDEFTYISVSFPNISSVIEDMYVAAANSPHNERFENEYFGDGLIEKYKDGGRLTDELVALLEKEESLEAEYSSLASSDELSGTSAEGGEAALKQKKTEIFIELIRTRRLIADELGYKSYAEYAYESLDRDYSSEKASALLDDICEYILPAYQILSYTTLAKYIYQNAAITGSKLDLAALINSSRELLSDVDEGYGEIFNYMLQYGLFDLELDSDNRNSGSFVTYLMDYEAPFLFVSASGTVSDYTTFIHEFGHFIDTYINNNSDTSIDQKEISSQALEYLALTRLDGILSASDVTYLTETQMLNAMVTLIFQGFYAKAEELIYALPYDKITKESLDAEVVKAATSFSLNTNYINDVSAIFITHTFLYPFYVQSYCTSLIPALEIYFMELENEGAGFEAYKKLVDRNGENFTLEEALLDAGIASPFKEDILLELAGKILSYVTTGTLPEKNENELQGAA